MRPSYFQPALFGGLVMGVLSALPLVAAGNACCCLWVVSGGAIAAYLLQQNQASPITPGDGVLVGFLAGIVGAFVQFVLAIPIGILVAPMERAILQRLLDVTASMPPDVRAALERYAGGGPEPAIFFVIILRIVGLIVALFVGSIFSTLGGLVGAVVFRKTNPEPGV